MARILDQPRYKCALAAMQTVQAIPRAIPILHSGPGCGAKLNDNSGTSGLFSPNIFPCTSVSEKEVIFGGTDKLKETIENALKIIDADMFVVLTGCTSEIIGDDVGEVVQQFKNASKPVLYANTPGFRGNNYEGHDWILKALFEQYLPLSPPKKRKGLVNLFAGPPMQDPFWLGNLRELESLVAALGLTPNTIFGHGRGVLNIDRMPEAEFNVLVSPWVGIESARFAAERYGAPLLHYPVLPIGAFETSKFLRAVGEFADVDTVTVERAVNEREAEYYYYIERYADIFLEQRIMSKRFVAVSDSQYALAYTKFLVNDLGMYPTTQYLTDSPPEQYRDAITAEFRRLNYGIEAEAVFETECRQIHERMKATDFGGYPLILGSSWERTVAQEIPGHFVNISYPMVDRLVINGHVAGYSGGLKLLEDIYTVARGKLVL
ncbi:nitrogenase component 1 [Treponema endosymbiont of Eucomonympha sp.]|uniref:nitrogenase component 1 n=1 Tax=Treponema endosymbiont of Eucomonympha sp. TaxID=1580831 RepID=UPI0007514268|nr:nitrogenase component 1 [Treponema endosymbiont of Eucomonympha sp.]